MATFPLQTAQALLDNDHDVSAWSGVLLRLVAGRWPDGADHGQTAEHGRRAADPVRARAPSDRRDRARRATTLAHLHKHVGDTVEASYGDAPPTVLHIVGTATMPAVGPAEQLHLSMGTGALVPYATASGRVRNSGEDMRRSRVGRTTIFVRLRARSRPGRPTLRPSRPLFAAKSSEVSVLSVQRPAEIVNYRSMGSTPAILGAAPRRRCGVALVLTLIASVRRRRRDLALLKTLGFTRRQLAAAGRMAVDDRSRHRRHHRRTDRHRRRPRALGPLRARAPRRCRADRAAHRPSLLVALGALVLANLVAAVPGRQAARIPDHAAVLQSE